MLKDDSVAPALQAQKEELEKARLQDSLAKKVLLKTKPVGGILSLTALKPTYTTGGRSPCSGRSSSKGYLEGLNLDLYNFQQTTY